MIPVYIPLAQYPDQQVYSSVLLSLRNQTVETEIFTFKSGGDPNISQTHRTYNALTTASKVKNRNDARDHFLASGLPYALFQDYDCEHLINTNIEDAIDFLDTFTDYGAVSFKYPIKTFDQTALHIDAGCVLWVRECMEKVKFRGIPGQCTCALLTADIRNTPLKDNVFFKYGCMDAKHRVRER